MPRACLELYVCQVVLMAQVIFLLDHGQTDTQSQLWMQLITLSTPWQPPACVTVNDGRYIVEQVPIGLVMVATSCTSAEHGSFSHRPIYQVAHISKG